MKIKKVVFGQFCTKLITSLAKIKMQKQNNMTIVENTKYTRKTIQELRSYLMQVGAQCELLEVSRSS